jgi:hypothetical protein
MDQDYRMSREGAEDALRERDWMAAMEYWANLQKEGSPYAETWLNRIESEAELEAETGDMQAQAAMGAIGAVRYLPGDPAAVRALRKGVRWYVAASRQEPGGVMLDMVVYWNGVLQSEGVHDPDIEEFLSAPDTQKRYRELRGADIPGVISNGGR